MENLYKVKGAIRHGSSSKSGAEVLLNKQMEI